MDESQLSTRTPFARRTLLAATIALPLGLSACVAEDSLAQQARAGDNKGYIAGDGTVSEYPAQERKTPLSFTAKLFDGTSVDATSFAGKVTVLNFWYAACAPCRVEAPELEALHQEFTGKGVDFYGVNIRDEKGEAEAFERTFKLTYPSFDDRDGSVLLAVAGIVPPGAVPTTLVLDKQGRISARILGQLQKGTLKSLIETAVAE